jgi:hypothetical protein
MRTRLIIVIACAVFCLAIAVVIAIVLFNPPITRYFESPRFRAGLERETAKGLHFPSAQFAPITRTGPLSATTNSFSARDGWKAITRLDAHEITGRFNPVGIFARRWQIDDLHIERAQVGVQVYEPKPEPTPPKPWYHVFLPDHVYLKRTWSDHVDVTWPIRGQTGGIFETKLVVTPHGRDFEYRANGGTMKNSFMPDASVQSINLLITKKLITLYNLDLASGEGTVHGAGTMAISGEKRADFSFKWNALPVREWLPKSWTGNFAGAASGDLHWTGNDYTLAAATMTGMADVKNGRVSDLKFLDDTAAITNHRDLAVLELNECRFNFRWREGDCEFKDIAIEQHGKFRIEGTLSFSRRSLGGALDLGVAPEYLDWLPNPEEIFSVRRGGYLSTTVHLSGTLDAPKQDLSPRLLGALKESPGALFSAALRELSAWLQGQ